MREVEFLPDWYPKVRRRRRMVGLQAWVTLLLIGGLGLWMMLAQRNVHAREVQLAGLHTDLSQTQTELQHLDNLLELQRDLSRESAIVARIGVQNVEATRVLTTLADTMPPDMALLDLTLNTEAAPKPASTGSLAARAASEQEQKTDSTPASVLRFTMHGVAPTDVDLAEFLAKLTAKPFFKQIVLRYSRERIEKAHVMREFEVSFALDLNDLGGH